MEIRAERPHAYPKDLSAAQVNALQQCLDLHKIRICCLSGITGNPTHEARKVSWIDSDRHRQEERIQYTRECLRLAAAMGIPCILTEAGGIVSRDMQREGAWDLCVNNVARVLPLAEKLGVTLIIQSEPGFLIESTEHLLDFLRDLDFHPRLKANMDVGNVYCAGEDILDSWMKISPHAAHIHLADIAVSKIYRYVPLGEGILDIPRFLEKVSDAGYNGFATVRLDFSDQKAEDVVTASADYLRRKGFLAKKPE